MSLNIGDQAPAFKLLSDENKEVSLNDFKGKKFVLYFYPKDSTPGCTKEACDFRDEFAGFKKLSVPVIGISRDSIASHKKFKLKYLLPFILLSDANSEICKAYGVLVGKSMFGRKYLGIERATFLIDENGKVQALWRKVKVPGHVAEILQALKAD